LVQLEFEGRYAAMLSHEPKNYALLHYDGSLLLRGVAFRSSRAEPFGEKFLRRAIGRLLVDDVVGVHETYLATVAALRRREISTHDVSSRVRLTKTPEEYLESRERRRELAYDAMFAAGRKSWSVGDRIRVYRNSAGDGALVVESDDDVGDDERADRRDYDIEHYVRLLRESFAVRLARAFTHEDFAAVFADPDQPSLFQPPIDSIHSILTSL
jgi:DNA polymerase elongation subunit (family B)